MTPWVRRLLAANALIYLLALTVFPGGWLQQSFGFTPAAALARPWTWVSYAFVHSGFLHLAFNLLMLFFFGPAVEERLGGRRFVAYYLFCALGGAVLSAAVALVTPVAPFVGASAPVFGVALAFAATWPDAPILIFPLPVPIKAKWLVVALASLDVLLALSGARDGVAHLAHLGGLGFGALYLWAPRLLAQHRPRSRRPERHPVRPLAPPAGSARSPRGELRRPAPHREEAVQAEIDRLLDKISAEGIESLTPEERRLLAERSRQLREH